MINKWLDPKKIEPKIGKRYLVYYENGDYIVMAKRIKPTHGKIEIVWHEGNYYTETEPLFYMELPEPPKGE